MADEGNPGGIADMDLNLNLGLPPSYLNGVLDLGSDLAINSSSTPEEEIKSPEPEVPVPHSPSIALPDDGAAAPGIEDLAVAPLLTAVPLNEAVYVEPLQTVAAANEGIPENSTSSIVRRPSSPATFAPFFLSWSSTQGRRENEQSSFGQVPPGFVFPGLIETPYHSPAESPIQHPSVQPLEAPERVQDEKGSSPVQGSEEESSEETKNNAAAEFECNVCFDTPKDPVVTSCGHLFCWPCLYEWIQRNQDDKQCPMCKGELSESNNIMPIYGRGNSVVGDKGDNKVAQGGKHGPVIPLRPRGNRFESFNQWFEAIFEVADDDTAVTWRGLLDEGMRTVFQRVVEPSIREMFNTCYVRLMEMQMDEGEFQIGANIGDILRQRVRPRQCPQQNGSGLPSSSTEECLWRWFILSGLAKTQRLIAQTNLDKMFERIGNNPFSGVTIAAGSPTEHQPSASSTMAVIQGDVVVPNAAAEPNSAESSGTRRRMRNNTSGLLNGDDGDGHPNTRRRLD